MEGIEHIGIAVHSIEKTLPFYTNILQMDYKYTEIVESQGVKVAFLDAKNIKIELLEPLHTSSPIASFLEKRGEGIHHIAIKTNDINRRIIELEEAGIEMIHSQAKIGAGGAKVAFIHPKSTFRVLYELCEKRD